MKDILLITNYWHFESEKASSRYLTLANMIVESGMKLEIITSSFYHATKSHRQYNESFLNDLPYKISLIHESGYAKNISIKRILSHREFAKNVMEYIENRKKPDAIYCVVPSLDVAYRVTEYANRNNIKVILDIQDLWPEAFRMALDIPILSDLVFFPMRLKANRIYAAADEIIAVSKTYVDRALKVNKKCKDGYSVFLGTELSYFDQLAIGKKSIEKPKDEIWIAYIGTLGYSYDIPSIISALSLLQEQNISNIKFIIMGDGPLRTNFENYAMEKGIKYEFTGRLEYSDMVKLLCDCDIAVNPIVGSSAASIINKVGDYAAAGLPVINTQDCKEYKDLLNDYNAGLNCKNGSISDIAKKIMYLCKDESVRKKMGRNNRNLAEEVFDRNRTYNKIVKLIEKLN